MRGLVILLLTTCALVACKANKNDNSQPVQTVDAVGPAGEGKTSINVPRYWNLENVEVTCGAKSCPPQVGILFFYEDGQLDRCTATLIKRDQVLTTGHCDGEIKNGYFILGAGSQRQVRRLKDRVFKVFTPNPKPGVETSAPSALIFLLDKPIENIPKVQLASGPQINFSSLTAFVINAAEAGDEKYKVEALPCVVRRHEAIAPFDLSEMPDIIWSFDCNIEPGNSGAPMFAKGNPDIQAIQQGVVAPEKYAEDVRREFNREPVIYEKHRLIMSTNVRCVSFPGTQPQTCTKFEERERSTRFLLTQKRADQQVMQHAVPARFAEKFNYQPYVFSLVGNRGTDQSFEIFYMPTCRKQAVELDEVEFPSELVRYSFDEWANPIIESKGLRVSIGSVIESSKNFVTVDTQWTEPFAPLQLERGHPRRKWGKRFPIEIPLCAR